MKLKYLLVFTIMFGCASATVVPRLENRTLFISKDFAGFWYKYCVKKKFFSRKCKEWKIDKYDMSNKDVRMKLINMGFVARVLVKP